MYVTIHSAIVLNSKEEWTVGDTLDTNGMNNEEYKKKYQQQLQTGRRQWLEEYQKRNADIEQTIALMKDRELQTKELEKEIQRLNQLLQSKDQELIERGEKMKEYLQQIQQYEHPKEINIQEEETRKGQEKVQEIKLLHSSEGIYNVYIIFISLLSY